MAKAFFLGFRSRRCGAAIAAASILGLAVGCQGPEGPVLPSNEGASSHSAPGISRNFQAHPLVRAILGEPRTLDPQLADDESSLQVIRDLFEGLTSETPDGNVAPGIAASWTVNDPGTTYRFHLRRNARWSDGDKIVADEVVEGLRRAVDPKTAAGFSSQLSLIKNASEIINGRLKVDSLGVSAIDDETVQIVLERPATFFLQLVSQPICAPVHHHDGESTRSKSQSDNTITSNGPFFLNKWVPGAYLLISRNPHYWNNQINSVTNIKYLFEDSESTELNQYLAGEIDITSTIPIPDFARISKLIPNEIQTAPILGTFFIALNVSRPPFANNQKLRQALSMAVERRLITERIVAGATPAFGFVANGIHDYTQQHYSWATLPRTERVRQARQLYAESGHSEEHPLRFTLYFNANEGVKRVMLAVAANWKENLGIDVKLVSSEFRVFLEERKDRSKWDAIRLGWYADYNDASSFLEILESTNAQNNPEYRNSQFDKLIHDARVQPNSTMRRRILETAEQLILNDGPVIPIYFYSARRLVKPNIAGASISPMNRTYSKFLKWK